VATGGEGGISLICPLLLCSRESILADIDQARTLPVILETAKQHFDDDISRARSIHTHATGLADGPLKYDLLRSAWMLAVGASDAFFCDAYADLITRTLRAKERQPNGNLQDRLNNLKVPVIAILNTTNGWRWRMAAREMIEKESVLSIQQVKDVLNIFCRENHKLLTADTVEQWILHPDMMQRQFGISRNAYQQTAVGQKPTVKKSALECFSKRMQEIFQRRHDCIHNCDRPKTAIQGISQDATEKAVYDVCFFVNRCTDHMRAEYVQYLTSRRFTGQTRNYVGA
jgi:hypothetical protein